MCHPARDGKLKCKAAIERGAGDSRLEIGTLIIWIVFNLLSSSVQKTGGIIYLNLAKYDNLTSLALVSWGAPFNFDFLRPPRLNTQHTDSYRLNALAPLPIFFLPLKLHSILHIYGDNFFSCHTDTRPICSHQGSC